MNIKGTHYKVQERKKMKRKMTGDTSLHFQIQYPKLSCFMVYLLGQEKRKKGCFN